jgi:hypothetical protein
MAKSKNCSTVPFCIRSLLNSLKLIFSCLQVSEIGKKDSIITGHVTLGAVIISKKQTNADNTANIYSF